MFSGRFILSCVLQLALPLAVAQADCPDLALVLAVDGSGSIDARDYDLQQQGYVAAFTNPVVIDALKSAGVVDVALVLWGDSEMAPQVFPWRRIRDAGDAARFAASLRDLPRTVTGNTGIGRGVETALDLIAAHGDCTGRKVINVSGDGRESVSPRPRVVMPLSAARARADSMGVTINALAITQDQNDLASWYEGHLIAGPGAFVIEVAGYDGFGTAIIQKLGREIAPPQLAARAVAVAWQF
jgi:Protein of unknown function (DUF1194)